MAHEISHESPPINWDRIERFVGYGQPDARVVFVGMEEGLGKGVDLLAELRLHSQFAPVVSLRDACRNVSGTEQIFDPTRGYRQPVWRAIAFLMAFKALGGAPSVDDCRRYRALRLGQINGDVLLTELLPYPHPSSGEWLYGCRFNTRVEYEASTMPARIDLLRKVIGDHPRDLIVCYGKSKWPIFEELFAGVDWLESEPFRISTWKGSKVMLTGHFSAPAFDSNASIEIFARAALRR